jgi:hypothetical protein
MAVILKRSQDRAMYGAGRQGGRVRVLNRRSGMMDSMEHELNARRREDFYKAWEAHKKLGFAQTQEEVDRLAAEHGIENPPKLAGIGAGTQSEVPPEGNITLFIGFDNKDESPALVAFLAARALVRLHFDMLMYINTIAHESRSPGSRIPPERIRKIAGWTQAFAETMFPSLKPTFRYEENG